MGSPGISIPAKTSQAPKQVRTVRKYKNKSYYSVPQAAEEIGVSRMTLLRWVRKICDGQSKDKGIQIEGFRDAMSGRFFVSVESVHALQKRERPLVSH